MSNSNDPRPEDVVESDGREPGPALEFAQRTHKSPMTSPPTRAAKVPTPIPSSSEASEGRGALPTLLPARAAAAPDVQAAMPATNSGGTAKTSDTTRAAGYVADLTKPSEPPPGPPIAKSPENFAGPESAAVPPTPQKSRDPQSAPKTATRAAAAGPGPTPPIPDPAGADPTRRSAPPTVTKPHAPSAAPLASKPATPSAAPIAAIEVPASSKPREASDTHRTILLPASDVVE
jgi:hypothetical protein